ncbi:hypothetical protein [Variovorax sp. V213]|uniref:hypothetical protein n=1 Tax=Variovorax sp. V213 TaxID=3065955 RepID=UPI0034E86381
MSTDDVKVMGWAWSNNGIGGVALSTDGGATWHEAEIRPRREFEWQQFSATLPLPRTPGPMSIVARARDADGSIQPLSGTRSAAHSVQINRLPPASKAADAGTQASIRHLRDAATSAPSSPRSHQIPAITAKASRATEPKRCSFGACCEHAA